MELIITNHHSFLATSLLFICLFTFSSSLSNDFDNQDYAYQKISSFSVELIHRDSPKSPFFDPLETSSQRLTNALVRSINRKNHLTTLSSSSSSPMEAQSRVYPNNGEYLMEISIGTPPFRLLAIADTGSDLTWTQCKPCTDCYNQTSPLFDPSSSTTYKNIPCKTSLCMSITRPTCETKPEYCPYSVEYGDRSYSRGYLVTDTLTLASTTGRPVSFPRFIFGCGKENSVSFDQNAGSGIVGLGNGKESLVSQLDSTLGGKFSYCLVPYTNSKKSSKMNFGRTAVVSGPGSVSTPLFLDVFPETFYHLTLEGISVGDTKLTLPGGSSDEGNIVIDSGTTLTILPSDFYADLESAVAEEIDLERIKDPTGLLSLCYKSPESESTNFRVPILTVHFRGADVKLSTLNTFVRVSKDAVCFAFIGNQSGGDSIYGNLAQMNFLVGYDVQKKTLSFKPADCSKI